MKPKKKWLGSFITMLVLKAKAYIWIVITIGVCVVGGYIVYELWKIARLVNQPGTPPPYPETNDVTRVWLENYDGTNGFAIGERAAGGGAFTGTGADVPGFCEGHLDWRLKVCKWRRRQSSARMSCMIEW